MSNYQQLVKYVVPIVGGCSLTLSLLWATRKKMMSSKLKDPHNRVLVTGGAGYIGSHTVLLLLNAGWDVVVIDNLLNSSKESLRRVADLTKKGDHLTFVQMDLLDKKRLEQVFQQHGHFAAVIHFAGLKAVGESVQKPLYYYENNLTGTINLLEAMKKYKTETIVFSSSATVYGTAASPVTESSQVGVGITNPYGQTKYMIEKFLEDLSKSPDGANWQIVVLRYFNPVGAHESGRIGESPNGIPNNLMPYVSQVAVGRREKLTVYGKDYKTKDGTGVRDYIHVMDLAQGHLAALDYAEKKKEEIGGEFSVFNLGTGQGYSVLQMIKAMEKASGKKVAYEIGPRRPGDLATVYSDPQKAQKLLGWKAARNLDDMCKDLWRWQEQNPHGFDAPMQSANKANQP